MIDWSEVFDEQHPEPGASAEDLAHVADALSRPLSPREVEQANALQVNLLPAGHELHSGPVPFDPARWKLPARPLPPAYLEFLRYSNGGSFRSGERWFDAFLRADQLRQDLLDYQVPEYMPGSLLFAMDGSGDFYLFDMRSEPDADGEYPVLFSMSGNLCYEDAVLLGSTFLEVCRGTDDPALL